MEVVGEFAASGIIAASNPDPIAARETRPMFPPLDKIGPHGLVRVGGQLTVHWLLEAYRRGIFPWPVVEGRRAMLAWFSPDPRAILPLDRLHVPKRLERRLRSGEFTATLDTAFDEVIQSCAAPRDDESAGGTWLVPSMIDAYRELHRAGHSHSIEVWHDSQLVGGLYGVAIGGFFAGESMFHRRRDASKAAVAILARHLSRRGYSLLDIQQSTPHLVAMGAIELPRRDFLARLAEALPRPCSLGPPGPIDISDYFFGDQG